MTIEELKQQCPMIFGTRNLYKSRKNAIVAQKEFFKNHKFIFESLTEMQAKVLRARYGVDNDKCITFRKLAVELGVTPARVQQLEEQAFSHLRQTIRMNWLMDYTDETFDYSLLDEIVINFDSLIRKDIIRTIREDSIVVLQNVSIDNLNIKIGRMPNKEIALKNKLKDGGIETCADLIKYLRTHSDFKEFNMGYNSYSSCILAICGLIDGGFVNITSTEVMEDYKNHTNAKNKRLIKEEIERLEAKAKIEEKLIREKQEKERRLKNASIYPENVYIEDLDLSVRSSKALKLYEISTLEDLIDYCSGNIRNLMNIRNLGITCMEEISSKLIEIGILNENMKFNILKKPEDSIKTPNKIILEDLGFSTRSYHYLKNWGINTLDELIAFNNEHDGNFCIIDKLGSRSESEILSKLQSLGVEVNTKVQ